MLSCVFAFQTNPYMRRHKLVALILFFPIFLFAQYPFRDTNLKWAVIDTNLVRLTARAYDTISLFKDGYAIVVKSGRFGHIREKGQPLYLPQYDSVGYYDYKEEGSGQALAVAKIDGRYGLIQTNAIAAKDYPLAFDWIKIETPSELAGYRDPMVFIYQKDSKYGCKINGRQIGKPKYDSIYINFGNPKHLFFKKKKKEYFLTEAGSIERTKGREFASWAVGDPLYFIVEILEIVEQNGKKGLRHIETGQMEVPPVYEDIQYIETEGFILITPDKKYGLVDNMGKRILADEYKSIVQVPEGLLLVEEFSGRKGYLVGGKLLLP